MAPLEATTLGIVGLLGLAALVFWIAMIRDCWIHTEPRSRERRGWLLIVVLGKIPGALAYFLLRKRGVVR